MRKMFNNFTFRLIKDKHHYKVYEITNKRTNSKKILISSEKNNPHFSRIMKIYAQIKHDNFLHVYNITKQGILLEHFNGVTLDNIGIDLSKKHKRYLISQKIYSTLFKDETNCAQ
jgi:hypothetical protein